MSRRDGLSQREVDRLVHEIGPTTARGRGSAASSLPASVLARPNPTETAFLGHLVMRWPEAVAFRAGWPDFFVARGNDHIAVEVKNGPDVLSRKQRAMFAALERAGIRTYVWHPRWPRRLIPWRNFRPLPQRARRPL